MGNLAVAPSLEPLIPYTSVPCLPVLVKNQRRSMLDLGLDHSLGVVGSSAKQAGVITGPRGPGQASPVGTVGMGGEASPL